MRYSWFILIVFFALPKFTFGQEELVMHKRFKKANKIAKQENKPLIILFSATWCPPCQKMKRELLKDPAFVEMANEHFVFAYLDVDRNRMTSSQFKARSLPTMVFMKDEIEIKRILGYYPRQAYLDLMDRILNGIQIENEDLANEVNLSDEQKLVDSWSLLMQAGKSDKAMNIAENYIQGRRDNLDMLSFEWLLYYCEDPEFSEQQIFTKQCDTLLHKMNQISVVDFMRKKHEKKWASMQYDSIVITSHFKGLFGQKSAEDLYIIYASLFIPYTNISKAEKLKTHIRLLRFLDQKIEHAEWSNYVKLRFAGIMLAAKDKVFLENLKNKLDSLIKDPSFDDLMTYDLLAFIEHQKGNYSDSMNHIKSALKIAEKEGVKFESVISKLKSDGLIN